MSYPAAVENSMMMGSLDPNYNPADVMRAYGGLALQKKKWQQQFDTGQSNWLKEFGLKEKEQDLRERSFQAELDQVNRQLEEAMKEASFQRGFGVLQMGAGTPEERAQFYNQFDLPFTKEGTFKIPGYGNVYGNQALQMIQSGGSGGVSGGIPGAFDSSAALKELEQSNRIMPSYSMSARSAIGPEMQIYSGLQDRAKKLSTQLSRAHVPGF